MGVRSGVSIKAYTEQEDALILTNYRTVGVRVLAQLLNRTHNSVIGRAYRLGVSGSSEDALLERKIRTKKEKPPKPERLPRMRDHLMVKRPTTTEDRKAAARLMPQALPEETITPLNGVGVKIWDIQPSHCRWVMGEAREMTFCGHTKRAGSHYCEDHYRKSVVKK